MMDRLDSVLQAAVLVHLELVQAALPHMSSTQLHISATDVVKTVPLVV